MMDCLERKRNDFLCVLAGRYALCEADMCLIFLIFIFCYRLEDPSGLANSSCFQMTTAV